MEVKDIEALKLKVKPAAGNKQIILITDNGIYFKTLASADAASSSQQKPKK